MLQNSIILILIFQIYHVYSQSTNMTNYNLTLAEIENFIKEPCSLEEFEKITYHINNLIGVLQTTDAHAALSNHSIDVYAAFTNRLIQAPSCMLNLENAKRIVGYATNLTVNYIFDEVLPSYHQERLILKEALAPLDVLVKVFSSVQYIRNHTHNNKTLPVVQGNGTLPIVTALNNTSAVTTTPADTFSTSTIAPKVSG